MESRALEGVYLETLSHGIYRVLVTCDDVAQRILESRHVTCDKSTFSGAPTLSRYMDEEGPSDGTYRTDGSDTSGN